MLCGLAIGPSYKRCSHMSTCVQRSAGLDLPVKDDGKLVSCPFGLRLVQRITFLRLGVTLLRGDVELWPSDAGAEERAAGGVDEVPGNPAGVV